MTIPLTKTQLERVHGRQLEVVERLKKLLEMPEIKEMIREVALSGRLILTKNGLYIFHRGEGLIDPDYGTWDDDWYEKIKKPTLELVERFNLEIQDIEHIEKQLRD